MALARSERSPQRFYGMSPQIMAERAAYCRTTDEPRRGAMDATEWTL